MLLYVPVVVILLHPLPFDMNDQLSQSKILLEQCLSDGETRL